VYSSRVISEWSFFFLFGTILVNYVNNPHIPQVLHL
jgi:hypothetical protein